MDKSVLIVGAGVGGLAAGCYAQMNGYASQILEMHALPGGVCTAWKRKGYTFDGCIHHLAGCSPDSALYRLWEELGVLPRPVYYPEDLTCIEDVDGRRFTVYTDLDRLEAHMLELSPADGPAIKEFVQAARRFTRFSMFDMLMAKPWEMLKVLPHVGLMAKWGKVTLEQYAERFQDPFLRRALPMIQYDFPDVPVLIALTFLAGCSTRNFGWPAGGALEFARSIERRYLDLGGQVRYRSRVAEILVEPSGKGCDRAVGVRLEDGSEHRADVVISNADGYATICEMLGGRYTTDLIDTYYAQPPERQEMCLHVSLGVDRDLSDEPHALVLWLPEAVEIAGEMHDRLDLELFGFAPEMAPEHKSVIKALFASSYPYWKDLRADDERYQAQKQRVAETVIAQLERPFPGITQQVEVVDVATPVTVERFTGSHLGYQAWGVPNQSMLDALSGKGLSKTLPGLEGFYMVGQWAGGLGLPNVAAMGRKVIQTICKRDGRRFVTTS